MQTQLPAGQSNHLYKCTGGTSSLTTPFISDYTFLSPPPCIPPNHPGGNAVFPICKHAPSTQRKAEKVAYNSNRLQGKGVSQVALHTLTLPIHQVPLLEQRKVQQPLPFLLRPLITQAPSAFPAPRGSFTNSSHSHQPYICKGHY